jgi:hypothetical protein
MGMGQASKRKRFTDGKRGNTRGHLINGRANKDRRREEAFAREAAFNKLSLADKLKGLPPEGAQRQRARYTALLNKQIESQSAQAKKQQTKKAAKTAA